MQADSLPSEPPGKPYIIIYLINKYSFLRKYSYNYKHFLCLLSSAILLYSGSNYLLSALYILTEKENQFYLTFRINKEQVTLHFGCNVSKFSLISEFIQQTLILYLTALMSLCKVLWKRQIQVSHSPCLQGACTERRARSKSSSVYNARQKAPQGGVL